MLETVTTVLELAGQPMRARESHAAAEQRAGKSLRWTSDKPALAADSVGSEARFERVRRGYYRIKGANRRRAQRGPAGGHGGVVGDDPAAAEESG